MIINQQKYMPSGSCYSSEPEIENMLYRIEKGKVKALPSWSVMCVVWNLDIT